MRDKREFHAMIEAIDGKEPSAYEALTGDFDFTRFVVHNARLASGSGAAPEALFVLHVPQMIAGFPERLFDRPIRRTALEDYITRQLAAAIRREETDAKDPLPVGSIGFPQPGPHILPRSAVVMAADYVEARIRVVLPLRDGRVCGAVAERIFFHALPSIVNAALLYCYQDADALDRFVQGMEDADAMRQALLQRGLVAFAAEGARCREGTPALAVDGEGPVRATIDTPNAGSIPGLAIPAGVTLVLGDPYSGRRELLAALADGVYNHAPGDGREQVVAVPDAVQVGAEPGRPVQRVDLRAFLRDAGPPHAAFTAARATATESQMAGVVEALQAGAQALFIDESDSDPSFLSADPRLDTLAGADAGRVIPLSARVRQIADEWRASVVVGAWACAAPFMAVADTVLRIENGRVQDITAKVREAGFEASTASLPTLPGLNSSERWICPSSIDPARGRDDACIEACGVTTLRFGRSVIDLSGVRQLADPSQTVAIGLVLHYAKLHYLDEPRRLDELLDLLDQDLGAEGLDALWRESRGDLARPRRFEIAAAFNRLDALRMMAAAKA